MTPSQALEQLLKLFGGRKRGVVVTDAGGNPRIVKFSGDPGDALLGDGTFGSPGSSGAPADAEYIVKSASGGLSAERVLTDTATVTADYATAGQAKLNVPDNAITDAKLRDSAALSVIGRDLNSSGNPGDIAAGANNRFLSRKSNVLAFTQVDLATGDVTGQLPLANIAARTADLEFTIDGGGSVIATGIAGDLGPIDVACTIVSVTMLADQSGSMVVDIWKESYANYPPTVADTMTASAKPTISAATKSQDATLTGWTTSISAGDSLRYNVDSCSSIKRVVITLKVTIP